MSVKEMKFLSRLTGLVSLTMSSVVLVNNDLKLLTKLANLTELQLTYPRETESKFTGAGFKHLIGLQKLQTLGLQFHNQLMQTAAQHLAKLPALTTLDLDLAVLPITLVDALGKLQKDRPALQILGRR